jgi:hypothetical protein
VAQRLVWRKTHRAEARGRGLDGCAVIARRVRLSAADGSGDHGP